MHYVWLLISPIKKLVYILRVSACVQKLVYWLPYHITKRFAALLPSRGYLDLNSKPSDSSYWFSGFQAFIPLNHRDTRFYSDLVPCNSTYSSSMKKRMSRLGFEPQSLQPKLCSLPLGHRAFFAKHFYRSPSVSKIDTFIDSINLCLPVLWDLIQGYILPVVCNYILTINSRAWEMAKGERLGLQIQRSLDRIWI